MWNGGYSPSMLPERAHGLGMHGESRAEGFCGLGLVWSL